MGLVSWEYASHLLNNIPFNFTSFQMFILFIALLGLILNLIKQRQNVKKEGLEPPVVSMSLPFFGHGLAFSRAPLKYLLNCYEKYGKVFVLKLFRVKMLLICDPALKPEFFKAAEEELSLYDVISRLYFIDGFSDEPELMEPAFILIKRYFGIQNEKITERIESQACCMIDRLKVKVRKDPEALLDLIPEMMRFVASTSSYCFTNVQLTDEIFEVVMEFVYLLNQIIVSTYFFPKWAIHWIYGRRLAKLRSQVVAFYLPEVKKYRADPYKTDSMIIRATVDYYDEKTGQCFSDKNVCEMLLGFLYVSSENTALGIINTLINLQRHPAVWSRVKERTKKFLVERDFKSLFSSELLNACIMETARLNSHAFAVCRTPRNMKSIGGYAIGEDIGCVAMCEPLQMVYGPAAKIFKDSEQYNPDRFLQENPESFSAQNVMTWGAGIHLCPGKAFALSEIKMCVALILKNFQFDLEKGSVSEPDYFSPSAFTERKIITKLRILDESIETDKACILS